MEEVVVLGVGMTRFAKHSDRSLKDLSREALNASLSDAEIPLAKIEAAYVANAMAGKLWGQDSIRGQVFLSGTGLEGIPMFNIENACASASTAFHLAWQAVASGQHDVVLALGVEKMIHPDKMKTFQAFMGATDVEALAKFPGGGKSDNQSMFMDVYAEEARIHMEKYGTSIETIAKIAVKNSKNGELNPFAQYQKGKTLEEIMNSRIISDPLRLLMCSPLSDGAAAAILCSKRAAKKWTSNPIQVKSSVVLSGIARNEEGRNSIEKAVDKAYMIAGIDPGDIGVVEVHDAAAPGELWAYEQLRLCQPGDGGRLIEEGVAELTGRVPVNPSGGLLAKGHPVGATGIAQIAEIVWQMQGKAGKRQISKVPNVGVTENAGGYLNGSNAAVAIHVLTR